MKFKFPKKIMIGDIDFKVTYNPKINGASFKHPHKDKVASLEIGTLSLKTNPTGILASLLHELKEIIQIEQAVRYTRSDEWNNYEFHYTHKEHSDMCCRVAGLLTQFIK